MSKLLQPTLGHSLSRTRHLLKQDVAVERIAEQPGYTSEVALRKAFKREMGMPPAQYRKQG
jgi:transcriptional regulator GlxA family with amidase domain